MKKIISVLILIIFIIFLSSCEKENIDNIQNDEKELSVDIYGINDFHGAVNESGSRVGLGYLASYLKEVGNNENTITIDSGDTWQGSIESNFNRGALITDVFNYINLSARTVGNHDFDWGQEYLKANTAQKYDNYQTPVLAANVYNYDWNSKKEGNIQQAEIGKEYITYTLENGIKVGIVGVIGKNQITSISSQMTTNICFKNHIDVIKKVSDTLRTQEDCDIVIASIHSSQNTVLNSGLTNVSSVSGKKYVDLVFCGHSHQKEYSFENDVLFIQAGSYGTTVAKVTLTFDTVEKEVVETSHEFVSSYEIKKTTIDTNIQNLIDSYYNDCKDKAEEILSNKMYGSFYSSCEIPNMLCKAIYDEATKEGYIVDICYTNDARASLYDSTITYGDIFQALPFDNLVYIATVKGTDIISEIANYNYIYRSDSLTDYIDPNETYTIATIDYLAFHTNANRYYDYFQTLEVIDYLKDGDEPYIYRDILADWIKNQNGAINADDYSSSIWNYDRSQLVNNYY